MLFLWIISNVNNWVRITLKSTLNPRLHWKIFTLKWVIVFWVSLVLSSLWLMTLSKKARLVCWQAFFPGAYLCNEILAVSYNLYIRLLVSNKHSTQNAHIIWLTVKYNNSVVYIQLIKHFWASYIENLCYILSVSYLWHI